MKHVNRTITILVFIFLYIPMIVLAVASFNTCLLYTSPSPRD